MPTWPHILTPRLHTFGQHCSQLFVFPFSHHLVSQHSPYKHRTPVEEDCEDANKNDEKKNNVRQTAPATPSMNWEPAVPNTNTHSDQHYSRHQSHRSDVDPADFSNLKLESCWCISGLFLKASRYILILTGHLAAGVLGAVLVLLGLELFLTQTGPVARTILAISNVTTRHVRLAGAAMMFAGVALVYTSLDFFFNVIF